MKHPTIMLSSVVGGMALAIVAWANPHPDRPPGPPPEQAFAACEKLAEGDECSFTHHGRSVAGVCVSPPDIEGLVCAAEPPPGPPPEAVDACEQRKLGDACSFAIDGRDIEGECRLGPNGEHPLACAPRRR